MAIGASQQRTEDLRRRHDVVVGMLKLLTVPVSPRTLAHVIEAWTGEKLDTRAVTTQCRRDRKMWQLGISEHSEWLAPALHHETLEPIHALVTVSTWPLVMRVVTTRSPRVDRAKVVLTLVDEGTHATRRGDGAAHRLFTLAGQIARPIPGAVHFDGTEASRDRLRAAAAAEVRRFASAVYDERVAAGDRFTDGDPTDLMWGRAPDCDEPA